MWIYFWVFYPVSLFCTLFLCLHQAAFITTLNGVLDLLHLWVLHSRIHQLTTNIVNIVNILKNVTRSLSYYSCFHSTHSALGVVTNVEGRALVRYKYYIVLYEGLDSLPLRYLQQTPQAVFYGYWGPMQVFKPGSVRPPSLFFLQLIAFVVSYEVKNFLSTQKCP